MKRQSQRPPLLILILCISLIWPKNYAWGQLSAHAKENDLARLKPIYPEHSFCQFHETFVVGPKSLEMMRTLLQVHRKNYYERKEKSMIQQAQKTAPNESSLTGMKRMEAQAEAFAKKEGRFVFDDLRLVFQLENLDQILFNQTTPHTWEEYRSLHLALATRLGDEDTSALDAQTVEAFLEKLQGFYEGKISGLSLGEDKAQELLKEKRIIINQLRNIVTGTLIHKKRVAAVGDQWKLFLLQNSAFFIGSSLIATSLYLALAGGAAIISSPLLLVGIIAATGAAGVPMIKNNVRSLGEAYGKSQKYGTSLSCEQAEYFNLTKTKQLTEAGIGFGAGLVVGAMIALLPATASLLLAPLMAAYIGYMAYKEFKLAYKNYFATGGYKDLLARAPSVEDLKQQQIIKDHAHQKLAKSATESTVGLITLGLFVLVVYEGMVFIASSQQKALKAEKQKLMQFWARIQDLSAKFTSGGRESGSRSANLEAEELSAVLGAEGENIATLVHGDEELAIEVAELSKNMGLEGQLAELMQTGDPNQALSSLLQNFSGQGSGSEIFYSELSYYFAKLLELSSNDAAMIAHKMIDKHLKYAKDKNADLSHPEITSQEQAEELEFLVTLFGLKNSPAVKVFENY